MKNNKHEECYDGTEKKVLDYGDGGCVQSIHG